MFHLATIFQLGSAVVYIRERIEGWIDGPDLLSDCPSREVGIGARVLSRSGLFLQANRMVNVCGIVGR